MNSLIELKLESAKGHGILLPQVGIGLDTRFAKDLIQIISHAHADHVPYKTNRPILASNPTIDLMVARGFKGDFEKLSFFEPYQSEHCTITLYPAGHILGSAMIFIESEFGNLLYTGDFRFPASPTTEGCFFPTKPIDTFIAEATFGLPIYKWKSYDELQRQLIQFAQQSLKNGFTPIFLAYNLGKAQEVMQMLAQEAIPTQIHEAGFELCNIYSNYGIELGDYEKLNPNTSSGKALIMPSNVVDSKLISSISKKRIAYVSGWAALEARSQQMIIDERIALSDHIDFYELLAVVDRIKPQKTYITHSPNPDMVCHFLNQMGYESEPLGIISELKES